MFRLPLTASTSLPFALLQVIAFNALLSERSSSAVLVRMWGARMWGARMWARGRVVAVLFAGVDRIASSAKHTPAHVVDADGRAGMRT